MSEIISNGAVTRSDYTIIEDDVPADAGAQIVPLAHYLAEADSLRGRNDVGVWLAVDEEIEALAEHLTSLPVIALHFPAFTDGRHYSTAAILRKHYDYQGEIRAFGDVRIDQLEQMRRSGFNAFALADGQPVDKALAALRVFAEPYQSATDETGVIAQRNQV